MTVETIGRIRREHLLKGKTIKEIVRDLRVSRNTVRKVLRSGETAFAYDRRSGLFKKILSDLRALPAAPQNRSGLIVRDGQAGRWVRRRIQALHCVGTY